MAQAFYCTVCKVAYTAELRGKSCPACGEELVHGRVPSGKKPLRNHGTTTGRAVWDHIIKRDPCSYCGIGLRPKEITIDHIQPKALGGSKGSWTNRAGSCRPCNAAKAHTPLLFFMLEQQGTDISHLKNDAGHWPIPEEARSEEVPNDLVADARAILVHLRGGPPPELQRATSLQRDADVALV